MRARSLRQNNSRPVWPPCSALVKCDSAIRWSLARSAADQGWRVTIDEHMPEMMDLTVPEGAAFDWNDVFDAMIAARNSWRPSAYLAVINCAVAIGTQAALDFIGNYSDDTSPAHEIAAQTLARALGREDEWHTATIAGQHEPAP